MQGMRARKPALELGLECLQYKGNGNKSKGRGRRRQDGWWQSSLRFLTLGNKWRYCGVVWRRQIRNK